MSLTGTCVRDGLLTHAPTSSRTTAHAAKVYKYHIPRYLVGKATDVMVWDHVAEFRVARQELFKTDYTYHYYISETSLATITLGALPPREASKQRAGCNVAEVETQRSIVVLFIHPLQPS